MAARYPLVVGAPAMDRAGTSTALAEREEPSKHEGRDFVSPFLLSYPKAPFVCASMLAGQNANYSHPCRLGVSSPASTSKSASVATDHRSYRRLYRKCRSWA